MKGAFNEWGLTQMAFDMIEHACKNPPDSGSQIDKCSFYLQRKEQLMKIAGEILNGTTFKNLSLGQIVTMAATIGDGINNTTFLTKLFAEIAKTLGDPLGKMTPMGLNNVFMQGKKKTTILKHSVQMLLDEKSCSKEEVLAYSEKMIKLVVNPENHTNPCHPVKSSACCGYFGELASSQLEQVLLSMQYSVPHYINNYQPLANYLGLGDMKNFKTSSWNNVVPICRVPSGRSSTSSCLNKGFDTIWGSAGICTSFNSIPTDQMYQQTEWLNMYENIYRPGLKGRTTNKSMINGNSANVRALMTNYGINTVYPFQTAKRKSPVTLTINDYYNGFENKLNKMEIAQNDVYRLGLTMTVLAASDEVRAVPINKRKCNFLDETNSKMFM
jgi:hypothetical protein